MQITAPSFDETEIQSLRDCLNSGWVTQGPLTEAFERLIVARQQVGYVLATTSCTAALHLAALALGLGAGDEVVVPAFTWITSANCAEYVGARAVFADVDPITFNLDPAAFEAAITPRTKAVVVVHLFGLAAAMDDNGQSMESREQALRLYLGLGERADGQHAGGVDDEPFHKRSPV